MKWLALALVAAFMATPVTSEARRVRLSSTRDAAATLARMRAKAALPAKSPRCAECTKHGLSIARALFKQKGLGASAKGIFAGRDPVTNERKVVHLQVISEVGDTFTIRTQHIDGDTEGASVDRVFKPNGPGGTLVSSDGSARVRLIKGRGFFDYHDSGFKGDPE